MPNPFAEARARIIAIDAAIVCLLLLVAATWRIAPETVLVSSWGAASAILLAIGLATVVERRARLQRVLAAVNKRSSRRNGGERKGWRIGLMSMMRASTQRVTVLKDRQIEEIRGMLVSAGFRSKDAIVVFSFFKLAAPLVLFGCTAIWVFGFDPFQRGVLVDVGAVIAGALLGSKLPDMIVRRRRGRRLDSIRKSLPDTLDMLVICTEAGLGADAALKRVVAETGRRAGALSEELNQMALELVFMPERRTALERLAYRAPLPSIQAFANTLIQAERYGTPLARAFKVLSQEQRSERMMRAEEKAGRLPATMTVPMMIFILPALFIVLIGPAALDIMDNFINRGD